MSPNTSVSSIGIINNADVDPMGIYSPSQVFPFHGSNLANSTQVYLEPFLVILKLLKTNWPVTSYLRCSKDYRILFFQMVSRKTLGTLHTRWVDVRFQAWHTTRSGKGVQQDRLILSETVLAAENFGPRVVKGSGNRTRAWARNNSSLIFPCSFQAWLVAPAGQGTPTFTDSTRGTPTLIR